MWEITHKSQIKITPFFEEILGAKLRSYRQSWGAADPNSKRVFLKIWKDFIHINKGEVEVFWKNYKTQSLGKPERLEHLNAMRNGHEGIGILCERLKGTRTVKTFDDEQLFLLGDLREKSSSEYGSITCAQIKKTFSIRELECSAIIIDVKKIKADRTLGATTMQALINARIGQGKFGLEVRKLWNNRCSVTGSTTMAALEASHIQRWADSDNAQRLDPNNGLLLTASLHKLFDAGLISFSDCGEMLISSKLSSSERNIFEMREKKLLKTPSSETANYLSHHRTKIFQK